MSWMPRGLRPGRRVGSGAHEARTGAGTAQLAVADPAARRTGLPRGVVVLLALTLGLVVLLGVRQFHSFIGPVFLGLNLVLAVSPLMGWLIRKGVPPVLSAIVAALAVYTFLLAFIGAVVWAVAKLIAELPKYRDAFEDLYDQGTALLERFGVQEASLIEQLRSALNPGTVISTLGGLLSNVTGILGLLLSTVIVTLFLLFDALTVGQRMAMVRAAHPQFAASLGAFARGVRRYWVVSTIFGLIVAVLDVIALVWLGVPLALVWGVFSFVTNYIPNIGFVIGLVPPALMALLANGPTSALLVIVAYSVLNFVVQSLIQPKFTGEAVGVTATVSFLSLLVWAWVLGPLGALLALPATLLVKTILVDADPGARWLNAFLSDKPDRATPAAQEAVVRP